jgi:hypothetical protein
MQALQSGGSGGSGGEATGALQALAALCRTLALTGGRPQAPGAGGGGGGGGGSGADLDCTAAEEQLHLQRMLRWGGGGEVWGQARAWRAASRAEVAVVFQGGGRG